MMIRDLIKEINQKKNLELNLPKYLNEIATVTKDMAYMGLTFHYYTFMEMMLENNYNNVSGFQEVNQLVQECIENSLGTNIDLASLNQNVEKLNDVRNTMIKRMKVLTAYTDSFQNYEYVLNRMESKFLGEAKEVDSKDLVEKVMQYIFAENDNQTMNLKIQEVVGQLPVRMTKKKFLDLVADSLSIYKGSDIDSVESYIYMLRTAAGIDRPEGYETEFPELFELKKQFETVNFKTEDAAEYEAIKAMLEKAVNILETAAEAYYTLQEVVNDLLAVLLLTPYADMPGTLDSFRKEIAICNDIIGEINKFRATGAATDLPDSITKKLAALEGKQEKLIELRMNLESIFTDVKERNGQLLTSMMLEKEYNCVEAALKLQSNSMFIELDEESDHSLAHELFMKRAQKELLNEFVDLFAGSSQAVCRAIMANVLSKLPVFFNNQEEVKQYITTSIENCNDVSEKTACLKLIEEIINE